VDNYLDKAGKLLGSLAGELVKGFAWGIGFAFAWKIVLTGWLNG
jgi:hypothetical protein